jgi:hypothetical protein
MTVAESIILDFADWLSGVVDTVGQRKHTRYVGSDGQIFCSHEHRLSAVWQHGAPSIRRALDVWLRSKGELEDPIVDELKPRMELFRPDNDKWACVHLGEEAFSARWLGSALARSEVGRFLSDGWVPNGAVHHISYAYDLALSTGAARYHHIGARLKRMLDGKVEAVYYQRLLLAFRLADGSPVLCSVIQASDEIHLGDLRGITIPPMRPELLLSLG